MAFLKARRALAENKINSRGAKTSMGQFVWSFAVAYALACVVLLGRRQTSMDASHRQWLRYLGRPSRRRTPASIIASLAQCTAPQRCDAEDDAPEVTMPRTPDTLTPRRWAALYPSLGKPARRTRNTTFAHGSFEEDFARAVASAIGKGGRREIMFTVVDASYGDMIEEVRIAVGRLTTALVFVALDKETAVEARHRGVDVALLDVELAKKDRIYLAKYYAAMLLCAGGIRFLFFEMDIWFFRKEQQKTTLLDVVRAAATTTSAVFVLHTDNPYVINAGMYYILPDMDSEGTTLLFETIIDYARRHPSVFDQGLMNCILKRANAIPKLVFIRERDNCNEHQIDLTDFAIQKFLNYHKDHHGFNFNLVDAVVAASFSHPIVVQDTLAVHVLTSTPLTSANGKKIVAKELMLWEGTENYYDVGGATKYLALEGALASPLGIDDLGSLRETLTDLIVLATLLNRVLVLPPVYFMGRRFPSWELVDVTHFEWRETSFFANPRLRVHPDAKITRISLRSSRDLVVASDDVRWYQDEEGAFLKDPLRYLWAAASDNVDADVLFVAPRRLVNNSSLSWPPALGWDNKHWSSPWLAEVGPSLVDQCDYKHREKRKAQTIAPHFDCGTTLATDRAKEAARRTRQKEQTTTTPVVVVPGGDLPMLTSRGRHQMGHTFRRMMEPHLRDLPFPVSLDPDHDVFGVVPNWLPGKHLGDVVAR